MSAPIQTGKSRRAPGLPFILVTIFLDMLTVGVVIPVMPALVRQFSGSEAAAAWWLGIMMASFSVMQFLFAPVLGALSDRFGRRAVILTSVAGVGIDQLFMAFAPGLGWLLVARLIAGLTAANIAAANAYIADISGPEDRARNFGMMGAAFGVGFITGPAIGGLLGDISIRLPFMVAAGLAGANFLYGLFVLPESLAPANRRAFSWARANPLGSLKSLTRNPAVLGMASAQVCMVVAFGILQTVWVLYTTKQFGWDELDNGLSLAAIGLATAVVQGGLVGRIARRLGDGRTVVIGILTTAVGYCGYGLVDSPVLFYGCIVIHALGGISGPALQSVVSNNVGPDEQGAVQGALASVQSLTFIVSPLLGAELFARFTAEGASLHVPGMPFYVATAALLVSALLATRSLRRTRASILPTTPPAPSLQQEQAP